MATERAMTLEQVRDGMRAFYKSGEHAPDGSLRTWANAIDAHLRAEPDYWAAVADDGEVEFAVGSDDTDADRTEVNQYINDRLLNDKTKLRLVAMYTTPPAQAQDAPEVTNEMVLRACHASLDWERPLTHFEARKVLEAAMAREGE